MTTAAANDTKISMGDTIEIGAFRVHCGACTLSITELTNAGKRGRSVRELRIVCKAPAASARFYIGILVEEGFAAARRLAADAQADGLCELYERTLRGVDVAPAGMGREDLTIGRFAVMLDWSSFSIRNLSDPNETTVYGESRADAAQVRAWVKSSPAFLEGMTSSSQVERVLAAAGIRCRSYCGMD